MVRHVYYTFMLQSSREEYVGFFSDNGERLDSQFGSTILREAVRFPRRTCNIPDEYRPGRPEARCNLDPGNPGSRSEDARVPKQRQPLGDMSLERARPRSILREAVW